MKTSAQYFPVVLLIMLYFAFALIVRPFYLQTAREHIHGLKFYERRISWKTNKKKDRKLETFDTFQDKTVALMTAIFLLDSRELEKCKYLDTLINWLIL